MINAPGIDISKWDGGPSDNLQVIDFTEYRKRYPFVVIKVSEGTSKDPLFARQWEAARGRVMRQPYHFFRSFVNQKVAVQNMMDLLGNDQGELEAALDAEAADGSTMIMSLMHVWADEYHRLSGKWPTIYSTIPFMQEHGAFTKSIWGVYHNAWLANCRFWLAQYPFDALESMTGYVEHGDALRTILIREVLDGKRILTWPRVAAPLTGVEMWQWTSRCPPEDVPGYYLGANHKLAVDHNFHTLSLSAFNEAHPQSQPGEPAMLTGTVNASPTLNIRSGPGTENAKVGTMAYGAQVEADRSAPDTNGNPWWHLTKVGGVRTLQESWCAAAYLTITSAPPPPPSAHVATATVDLDLDGVLYGPVTVTLPQA